MKTTITSLIFVIVTLCTFAQTPQSFNYQAVLRDASGNILANQNIEIQVDILQGSASGSAILSETHSTTTNNFGLVNLTVGSISSTDLSNIDWTDGPFFIQISVDGTIMGTSQLLSVPFAMHAITVENDAVEDDDADPENEIQVLSINADTIFLSSGGFVVLPPETDPAFTAWDKSSGISISESQISDIQHFNGDSITGNETAFEGWDKNANDDFTTEDETDPVFSSSLAAAITAEDTARWASNNYTQNELQKLKLENQQLSISDGNTIDLSDAYYIADSSATNELQDISLNGTQLSISKGSTVDLAEVQDGDKQRLSLGISNQHEIRLNISNANFVEMPFVKDGVSKYNWNEAENYVAKWGQYGAMVKSTIYDNGNIGIGTEAPGAKLEITGQIKITGGEPGDGKVLTSDASGLASWKIESDPQVGANTENYLPKWDGSKLISGTVYDNGNIGIGTNTPGAKLEVAGQVKITGGEPGADKILVSDASGLASWKPNLDNDPTNELQTISRSGLTVALSRNGGTFQDSILTEADVDKMVENNGYQLAADDEDTDSTNELQFLNISNDTIFLSKGNYAKLPSLSKLAAINNSIATQLKNVSAPTDALDAVNKSYLDSMLMAIGDINILLNTGYTIPQIFKSRRTVQEFLTAGLTYQDFIDAGVSYSQILNSGGIVPDLLDSIGLTYSDLLVAGVTYQEILGSGGTVKNLLNEDEVEKDDLIGLLYSGGIIIIINDDGSGFVCSTKNFGNYTWGCGDKDINTRKYNDNTESCYVMTKLIVDSCGANTAAGFCYNLTHNGYNDWALPAYGTLNHMFSLHEKINAASTLSGGDLFYYSNLENQEYWSSTDKNDRSARMLRIYKGEVWGSIFSVSYKSLTNRVRPIRKFIE